MIEELIKGGENVVGIKVTGRLTDKDYKNNFYPLFDSRMKKYGKIKCLLYLPKDFEGWTPKAAWDDMKLGFGKYKTAFEKLALVGGPKWVQLGLKADAFFTKTQLRVFPLEKLEGAWTWIKK